MSKNKQTHLVEFDGHTICSLDVCLDDLKESLDYLRWAVENRQKESFEKHAMFFEALMDELEAAIGLLENIRPPTRKYSSKSNYDDRNDDGS
jgi:hypothetical protein